MPLTPPQSHPDPLPSSGPADADFFNLFMDDEFSKSFAGPTGGPAPSIPPPSEALSAPSPFDFMSGLNTMSVFNSHASNPSSTSSPGSSGVGPSPPLAIDPQLVGTPASMDFGSHSEDEDPCALGGGQDEDLDDVDEDEEDDQDIEPEPTPAKRPKGSRKGTVVSGGVVKKSASSPLGDRPTKKEAQSLRILEPEDWRPSPEEYKKMSSKEKRQLRNKISARNFRVRRKEYITTLEGDIADRDRVIDAIRTELGSSQSENTALRQEIDALKRCLLDSRGTVPELPPPAPLPEISAGMAHKEKEKEKERSSSTPSSPLIVPNTRKDLPTSPRLGGRAFWGGLNSLGGGATPVHTTLVPPFSVSSAVLAGKHSPSLPSSAPIVIKESENINPGLNPLSQQKVNVVEKKGLASGAPLAGAGAGVANNGAGFDSFAEMNPFTLKTLDAYRMHLWGKMAAQAHHNHQLQQQQQGQQAANGASGAPSPFSGHVSNMRPHFFSSTPSSVLSGKAAASAYPSPPSTPKLAPSAATIPGQTSGLTPKEAQIAALAGQTLLSKLGSAFWEAFSGSSPAGVGAAKPARDLDAEKVRKVLEGRAVVKVVDVEPTPNKPAPTPKTAVPQKEKECSSAALLEESMRCLSIGKRN
ncbi:hypothetical protein CONPUDRAFT_93906 [Coniophora puteana RWD-64-598 SS2]|uniref:BZIP domain-containing protein n=1 Tax=Coniophora puteana (strain RWD-64-598) TaxID=741705 RepID=R7SH49_CONPW|nr:uncharacterized protein CONPUDRAFT_93906 [Coniophora puteana RWD-64-598 SS2]EIW74384.1 hypothetical protein CONPUDRAFT_93906 [Coniophora puteana RWD-64-598 SS2]